MVCLVSYFRKKRLLTQSELASVVGCSKNTISSIETCMSLPNVVLALRIADALSCSVSILWQI